MTHVSESPETHIAADSLRWCQILGPVKERDGTIFSSEEHYFCLWHGLPHYRKFAILVRLDLEPKHELGGGSGQYSGGGDPRGRKVRDAPVFTIAFGVPSVKIACHAGRCTFVVDVLTE